MADRRDVVQSGTSSDTRAAGSHEGGRASDALATSSDRHEGRLPVGAPTDDAFGPLTGYVHGFAEGIAAAAASGIPRGAFVTIGQRSPRQIRAASTVLIPPSRRGAGHSANDNGSANLGKSRSSVWRDLLFLLMLAASLIGAFYTGRTHSSERIIVVPGPSSHLSVVT
jgi:hypothetical protein